jgi:triacylglycerol esterase/lipase EstA (alpha/beta hydrolase family)
LVNATFANEDDNWVYLSPTIANAGYCVYTFNYGVTISQNITALGDIATSAGELATEVNNVLTATGAKKVDLVGHSQGGMMPNYYIKFLGGASKVATFIGLAPSNHGTTLDGLTNLGNALDLLVGANSLFSDLSMPALAEQEAGSQFETNLFASGDTVPGPRYVVIETKYDEVVTPYTNAFLKGATNILIQNQCPFDFVGHIGMAFDGVVAQDVLNQLGNPNPWFQPSCWSTGPWF